MKERIFVPPTNDKMWNAMLKYGAIPTICPVCKTITPVYEVECEHSRSGTMCLWCDAQLQGFWKNGRFKANRYD